MTWPSIRYSLIIHRVREEFLVANSFLRLKCQTRVPGRRIGMILGVVEIVLFRRSFFLYSLKTLLLPLIRSRYVFDVLLLLQLFASRRWLNTPIKCQDCSLRARLRASDLVYGLVDVIASRYYTFVWAFIKLTVL